MPQPESRKRGGTPTISCICADGTMVEMLYRPAVAETALVISRGGMIESYPEWRNDGVVHRPVSPYNNLLKHAALLLPSDAEDYGSVDVLLDDLRGYISSYVCLAEEALSVCAAYVLLSWVYDAFNELPYLRFRGDYGTGKTRALMVVGAVCYKAFFASGASTVSPIFHTLDSFKGTLVFDEADFRFTDEKAELVKILNNGNVNGFPVLRTQITPTKEFDPRAFAIFGPKIVGMRRSYEDRALESRFLTIEMRPGHTAGVPINLPERQKDEALHLRNKLLMFRFRNRLAVKLDPSLADPELEPRLNQILLPMLSVTPRGLHSTIRAMVTDMQRGIRAERSESVEGQMLGIVSGLLKPHMEGNLSLSDIATAFAAKHGRDLDHPVRNRWIGAMLRRLGIGLYKSNGIFVLVPGQRARLDALCARYGVVTAAERASPEAL